MSVFTTNIVLIQTTGGPSQFDIMLVFRHSSSFVHVLLISIQLQADTKSIPILLFIKYLNWYILSIRLQKKTWTKD